ncbi:hypothetical protein [Thermomonas mangrovi]|uniref:hypothetical protein n=1 Tax=Thermomonas mangrovi TaxID=2993316 RepID=UPI002308047B|nr:hypothetical protein [Thermomonas mangrovi]
MDYTRANIDHLRGRRSVKQVGEESGVGQSWLQRYMNPDKASGIQKANAEKVRKLAKYFSETVDRLTGVDLSAHAGTGQSQPVTLAPDMLSTAVRIAQLARDASIDPMDDETFVQVLSEAIQWVGSRKPGEEIGVADGLREVTAAIRQRR